jgi:hypothetical protein
MIVWICLLVAVPAALAFCCARVVRWELARLRDEFDPVGRLSRDVRVPLGELVAAAESRAERSWDAFR